MASSIKGRSLACGASVGAILGAAAALVPASCTVSPGPNLGIGGEGGAGGAGSSQTSTGTLGMGGMGAGGEGAGGDDGGTLVDLDGGKDTGHADAPHTGKDADIS